MINILLLQNLISLRTNLVGKSDIANLVNKTYFDGTLKNLNKKFTSNKTKNVLVENEF